MKNQSDLLILIFLIIGFLVPGSGRAEAQSPVEARRMGEEALVQEEYYRAVEYFKTAVKLNPQYREALKGLGEAYFYLGEYSEALDHIQKALRLDKGSLELLNFAGRIHVGLGNYDQARENFQKVLEEEPNNLKARFGFAEIDVLEGNIPSAVDRYRRSLAVSPENRRALLSLVLLHDAGGSREEAQRYVNLALKYHSHDPTVHFFAARHYLQQQQWQRAENHAKTVQSIYPDYPGVFRLLGTIYLNQERYAEAEKLIRESYQRNPDDPFLFYLLGRAQEGLQRWDEAVMSYRRGLGIQPDDGMMRLALENALLENYPEESSERVDYAGYYLEKGRRMEEENLFRRALRYYRRAVLMAPYSRETRLAFAEIHRLLGYPGRYAAGLDFLLENGYGEDQEIQEAREAYSRILEGTVADDWGVDQFLMDRGAFDLTFFIDRSASEYVHPRAGGYLLELARHEASVYDHLGRVSLRMPSVSGADAGYADFFRRARQEGSAFFAVITMREGERSLLLEADLYLSRTGGRVASYSVMRSGNGRVFEGMHRLMEQLQEDVPRYGTIKERRLKKVLINWGEIHGLEPGDELAILKKGSLTLTRHDPGYRFSEEDWVGRVAVDRVDEEAAEGTYQKRGFFDMVNDGDILLPLAAAEETEGDEPEAGEQEDGDAGTEPPGMRSEERERIFAEEVYKRLLQLK